VTTVQPGHGPLSVVVADDEALVRGGFRAILERQPDIVVVGEAADGLDVLRVCARVRPSVVLMDIRMPELDGIEATRRLTATSDTRVVVLTTFDLGEHVYAALRAGASGFLTKDTPPERLAEAVRAVAQGDTLLSPSVTRRLVESYVRLPPPGEGVPAQLARLTPRELEVLREMARGYANAEIAGRLYLSEATVKTHVARVLAKMELRDRVHAVVLAYESGLVRPGDHHGS
jgi:DNA-binding NarL/FixJ family response regulator